MDSRDAKRIRDEQGAQAAEARTAELAETLHRLDSILLDGLTRTNRARIAAARRRLYLPPPGLEGLLTAEPPPDHADFLPETPTGLRRVVGGRAYREAVAAATADHAAALRANEERERVRLAELARARSVDEERVDAARRSLREGDPDTVGDYFARVLDARPFPDGFPTGRRVEYITASGQLKVVVTLPDSSVIPRVASYRYVKTSATISEKDRTPTDVRARYSKLLGATVLRTLYEIFEADQFEIVDHVVLNGIVDTIDTATGHPIQPVLVSVNVPRSIFGPLRLDQLDPNDCLRRTLKARTSRSPAELLPVPPILEFDLNDDRFIEAKTPIDLAFRADLMDLEWQAFETLIHDLVVAMGYKVMQTRESKDRGVDVIAFREDPVFPLKALFQAKRYKTTVDAAAVREMYGTYIHEGATHGVVVTTSHFGPTAYEWIEGKQIQLWDGTHLLDLLKRYMGVEATIKLPVGGRRTRTGK
ncbi:restriction endonuclease [Frankia sp. CiP3]|uniref:restriction endonuclease n=1 Tax=Frankia sp. CiP3 TaxID=2880971 RepID=UPI001EF57B85|nr:restriction endonuclease [Frankia sp. CiP3]